MIPARMNLSGIPEDVLLLFSVILIAVILACVGLVLVVNYRDKSKERKPKE
jgi:hypothetical protein